MKVKKIMREKYLLKNEKTEKMPKRKTRVMGRRST